MLLIFVDHAVVKEFRDLRFLAILFINHVFDLPILFLEMIHILFCCIPKGIVPLNFLKLLFPIPHLGLFVMFAYNPLEIDSMMSIYDDVSKLLLWLDPISLVDYANVHVRFQVYVDWVFRDLVEMCAALLNIMQKVTLRRWKVSGTWTLQLDGASGGKKVLLRVLMFLGMKKVMVRF